MLPTGVRVVVVASEAAGWAVEAVRRADTGTRGPEDQRTRGPEDQRTRGPEESREGRGERWLRGVLRVEEPGWSFTESVRVFLRVRRDRCRSSGTEDSSDSKHGQVRVMAGNEVTSRFTRIYKCSFNPLSEMLNLNTTFLHHVQK